ncbi:hypothetical protein SUDANB15_07281 [Streptomyces sp. enrichment culture]
MVTYVATLDVPRHVVEYLGRLLAAHRRRIGTPRRSRALGPFRQAVLVLRWFRERGCMHCLARDAGVSQATSYRYLHEGIDVLANQALDLYDVLARCWREGMTHVILDGTLIESDRLAGVRENGNDLWFSQKHKAFGGNIQFLSAPDGTPLWVSDVEPGSVPDITAARIHVLPALYKAAADGLPILADKGYIGAGIGILIPVRRPKASLNRCFTPTLACTTPSCGMSEHSASAPPPSSSSDGAPCSTSRSAPAGSATSPARPLSSTASGSDHR